jgi:hypothetical protein
MGGAPAGPSRVDRLGPQSFPARPIVGRAGVEVTFDLERAAVTFTTTTAPARLVPLAAYRGVAVRMEPGREPGQVRVEVDLLHFDSDLTVRLAAANDPESIAADWQEWGRRLGMPLLVIAADGSVSAPLATLGGLVTSPAKARRRPAHFRTRRPRFLVRRRVGNPSQMRAVAGREIIAPE